MKKQGSTGKVQITDDDRIAPDAARRLGRKINRVSLPKSGGVPVGQVEYGKKTHKLSEPKNPPRSFRLSLSAKEELRAIGRTLGITNETTSLEACIHAVAQRLDINQ